MPLAVRYRFIDKPLTIKDAKHANPQKIGEALAKISKAHGGRLKKQAVVDAARGNRSHPVHLHLDWNDKIAGEKWRCEQASEIIRLIVRIRDDAADDGKADRAFLPIRDKEGYSYRTVEDVLGSRDLQLALMQSALRDLQGFEARYEELLDICALVREAREKLSDKIGEHRDGEARPH